MTVKRRRADTVIKGINLYRRIVLLEKDQNLLHSRVKYD